MLNIHKKKIDNTVFIVFILLFSLYFSPWDTIPNIGLYDETVELSSGLDFTLSFLKNYESSPLYKAQYFFLGHFFTDPVNIYYANHILMAFLTAITCFLAVRLLSGSNAIALTLGFIFAYANMFMIWPRVNYFTISIIFIGFPLLLQLDTPLKKLLGATLWFLILSLVRPEFALALWITILSVFVYIVVRITTMLKNSTFRKQLRIQGNTSIFILTASLIVVVSVTGLPRLSSGDRALIAIGQHYAWNVSHIRDKDKSADFWINYKKYVYDDFGDVGSVGDMIVNNPKAFFWHIWCNVRNLYQQFIGIFTEIYKSSVVYAAIVSMMMVGMFITGLISLYRSLRTESLSRNENAISDIFILFIACLPSLLAVVLIYPRQHYLLIVCAMVIIVLSWGAGGLRKWQRFDLVATIMVFLVIAFNQPSVNAQQLDLNREFIMDLRKFGQLGNVYEIDGGWCTYLPGQCDQWIIAYLASGQTDEFFRDTVDTIVVSPRLIEYATGTKADNALTKVLQSPESYGFLRKNVHSRNDLYVLMKGDESTDSSRD